MSRKRNFVPIFGSSHSRGASFGGASLSDGISHTCLLPDDIGEIRDLPNVPSSTAANSSDTGDSSYAHIQLPRRGGRRSQHVPSINKIMPPEEETRIRLRCYGKNSFIPYSASRQIGSIIRDHYSGPYPNWTGTLISQVVVWWERFKSCYWWPVDENVLIWENFNIVGASCLRNAVCRGRESVEKGKGIPRWMGDTNFGVLQDLSNREDFKKQSAINKENRSKSNAHHSCGSIPVSEHKRRLTKTLEREPRIDEIFIRTHKRRNGTFVDDRARDTIARYHEGMSRATQMTEDSNGLSQSLMTSLEVWDEAAGGMKQGNLYGLGSESSIVSRALSVPSHFVSDSPQRQNTEDIKALRQEMVAMTEKVNNM